MTKDEALDLALEALKYIHEGANNQRPHTGISWRCVAVKAEPAITAIKQARALDKMADNARELGLDYEPVQEMPITMQAGDKDCRDAEQICEELKTKVEQGQSCYCPNCEALSKELAALKAQPAPVQDVDWKDQYEKQKRRAEMWVAKYEKDIGPLEKAAPAAQRQWVGLTQKDIDIAFDDTQEGGGFNEFGYAIEQRLKEKNT